jgi:glutaconate CoA-transferase subunit A
VVQLSWVTATCSLIALARISQLADISSLVCPLGLAAGVLPLMYVSAVAEFKNAAWPSSLYAECDLDDREVENYAGVTRTPEGFQAYMTGARSAA